MKRVKRIFACLLALTMMFGLSATAFATESGNTYTDESSGKTYTDKETVTIKKEYKLTNADTISPGETFTLIQVGDGKVTDGDAASAPHLGTITGAQFDAGAATVNGTTGNITVALPNYTSVGVYEYTLQEVPGTTAGVTYYEGNIKLVVTVVNGSNGNLRIAAVHTEAENGEKSDTFTNTYSAGKLNISKTVTGNLGDKDRYFEFKVNLKGVSGKAYGDSYAISGGSYKDNPTSAKVGEETTFYLKHGETISIANLPYDVEYTVTETPMKDYETTKTGDHGTIAAAEQIASFTNDRTGSIDTGVYLDNLPYILVFAGVLAIAAVFVVRRRRFED